MTEPNPTPPADETATPKRKGAKPLVLAKAAARYEKATRKLEQARQRVRDAEEASRRLTEAEEEYRDAKEAFDELVQSQG